MLLISMFLVTPFNQCIWTEKYAWFSVTYKMSRISTVRIHNIFLICLIFLIFLHKKKWTIRKQQMRNHRCRTSHLYSSYMWACITRPRCPPHKVKKKYLVVLRVEVHGSEVSKSMNQILYQIDETQAIINLVYHPRLVCKRPFKFEIGWLWVSWDGQKGLGKTRRG
jgi:hypothetical protein